MQNKTCNMECGKKPWCCSVHIDFRPGGYPKNIEKECIQLMKWRDFRVYNVVHPRFVGIISINDNIGCKHITKKGCSINKKKPLYCKNYPDPSIGFLILPKACPFSGLADIILENLVEI